MITCKIQLIEDSEYKNQFTKLFGSVGKTELEDELFEREPFVGTFKIIFGQYAKEVHTNGAISLRSADDDEWFEVNNHKYAIEAVYYSEDLESALIQIGAATLYLYFLDPKREEAFKYLVENSKPLPEEDIFIGISEHLLGDDTFATKQVYSLFLKALKIKG